MYQFFFSLYYALFSGTWSPNTFAQAKDYYTRIIEFALNALGGHFSTFQQYEFFTGNLTAYGLCANILATITMFGVCFAVLKITKAVFRIFFGGR